MLGSAGIPVHRAGRLPQIPGEVGNTHGRSRLVVWVAWMAGKAVKAVVSRLASEKVEMWRP